MPKHTAQEQLRILKRVIEAGEPVAKVCRQEGISRTLFYRWLARYKKAPKQEKREALTPKKRKIYFAKKQVSPQIEKQILALVRKHPSWSTKKISQSLPKDEKGKPIVGNHGVQNVLNRLNLNTTNKRILFSQKRTKLPPLFRKRMLERVVEGKEPVAHICQEYGISRTAFYRWLKRWEKSGRSLSSLWDKVPRVEQYWRQLSEEQVEAILKIAIEHPEYSTHKVAKILPWVGNHGVQNVFRRQDLNTYEKRLAYAEVHAPIVTPVVGLPGKIKTIFGRIPVISAIPPPALKKIASLTPPFLLGLFASPIFSLIFYQWLRIIIQAPTLTSRLGLVFASTSLLIGSFFFAYSMKYYLTLAIVLSFSRQPLEGGGLAIGINGRLNNNQKNGNGRNWLQRIFGLGNGNGNGERELVQAGGLQPSLDHIKLERYPFVSIHLPFFNEMKVAERILKACAAMDYPNFEIIVCDDSTDETVDIVQRYAKKHNQAHPDGPKIKVLHRPTRKGFKGGALAYALRRMNPKIEFVVVLDADFIPYPDTLEVFIKYFKVNNSGSENYTKSKIAVVGGYQWHVLNKSENWITRGVRTEYAGSYVIERSGREILGLLKQISGSVYMIRADVLKKIGWGTSITEDFQLTLKLYERGYKVIYTPYIQAPAECVSTLKRLIRQRMRWAEGHSNNIRRMFIRLISSPKLTLLEKLEFIYLSPYYLQAAFFMVGTFSWLLAETVFRARLPFWTSLWGWSLVLTNFLSLPLVNAVGLFLEESEEKDYFGLFSFVFLSYILVPFQAYASLKGFIEKEEGPWFRTPKTGKITDIFTRGRFYRWIAGIFPGRRSALAASLRAPRVVPAYLQNPYVAKATANNRFDSFSIRPGKSRWVGRLVIFLVVGVNILLSYFGNKIPQGSITNLPIQARIEVQRRDYSFLSQMVSLFKPKEVLAQSLVSEKFFDPAIVSEAKRVAFGLVLLLSLGLFLSLMRRKRRLIMNVARHLFIFFLVASWFLVSWPVIWNNPRIPPEIQEAKATAYDDVVLATNGGPDYRIQFNGNITEEIKSQGTSGAPDSYVTNIIPNDDGQCADYAATAETVITNATDVNSGATTRKTVSFWVEIDTFGTGTGANARNIWEEGGATNWFGAYTANNDELYIIIGESSANNGYCYADGLSTGTLYHVVMQWQGSDDAMELWINGSLVDSTTASIGSDLSSHTGDWEIGGDAESRDHTDTDIGLLFDGRIADYSYWAEAADFLTEAEIVAIYEAGAVVAPSAPTLYNDDGGSNQIAFNNIRENDTTPIVRASATHDTTFNTFFVEFNTASDFSGTAYTETFSGTYSSGTPYNLQTTSSLNLPSTEGVTYYVRAKASDNGGTDYGDWSTTLACCGTWTYTYTSSAGDPEWLQTTDEQFDTGTLVSTQTSGSDSVELGGGSTTVYLNSGTTWNVPANWNSSNNTIQAIGAGGDGGLSTGSTNSGAGGEYRAATNVTLTASSTVDINIPSGGAGSGADGAWIKNGAGGGGSIVVEAKNGGNASGVTAGSGGTGGTGATNYDGGAGGVGASNSTASGGGGGGSAGPSGAGKAGGDGVGATNYGAGGGGGSNGGSSTAGETPTGADGGDGGAGTGGTGGGAGGVEHTSGGSDGTDGGGGGGGADTQSSTPTPGGNGGCDTAWDSTHGACGGGGGGGGASGTAGTADRDGGTGGTYGGGGGGCGISGTLDTGECDGTGVGGQSIIVITYMPDTSSGTIMSPEIDFDWFDNATAWNDVYWTEEETGGTIKVQVYYNDCGTIIPDGDFSGCSASNNSTGFTTSPVDISCLSTSTYNEICIKATLDAGSGTPYLEDWAVSVPENPFLLFGFGSFVLGFLKKLKRKKR